MTWSTAPECPVARDYLASTFINYTMELSAVSQRMNTTKPMRVEEHGTFCMITIDEYHGTYELTMDEYHRTCYLETP